ncbi:MAG: GspE/PulE family protein [Planctomycetota bacterium]
MEYTILNKKIKNHLIESKVMDEKTVNIYYEEAENNNTTLTQLLVDKKVMMEDIATSILALVTNLPPLDLEKITPDESLQDILSPAQIKSLKLLPISRINTIVTVAVINPYNLNIIDRVRTLLKNYEIRFIIVLEKKLMKIISELKEESHIKDSPLLKAEEEEIEEDLQQITKEVDSSPIINLVNKIIVNAIAEKASDIHIEPMAKKSRVRYRIYGSLREVFSISRQYHNLVISRIKILCGLDIAERRIPQDGKFTIRYEARNIDLRVSTLPSIFGEKCVIRILDSQAINVSLDQLGFDERALREFRRAVTAPYGMVLVTGPTGSGKSTTLYAALQEVMSPEENIVTIEDPVEYQIKGITQVQVNPKRNLTFASALRSILRQDPDIILVGEIRDGETAEIAIKAALTGHLVLSTLHTNDAPSSITRLVDMGVQPFLVASSLLLVSAQRLLKKLCKNCIIEMKYSKEVLKQIGLKDDELDLPLYRAKGCSKCHGGYVGRFAILEVLYIDDDIKNLILSGKSAVEIKQYAIAHKGMKTLRRIAIEEALKGNTSIEDVVYTTIGD